MVEVSNYLYEIGEVSDESIFIDGTTIEANAYKYTILMCEELIKVTITWVRYKSYKWLKDVTRETSY